MKIFSKFFDPKTFEKKLNHITYNDFSLFVDDIPKSQEDLSSINIIVLAEPNEYFGLHDWVIQNKNLFQIILTWNDRVLNTCDNALFFPFGHTWFKPYQYEKNHYKKFEIAHLSGVLNKSYGHSMRHEVIARQNEFKIPTNFHKTIGDRHNLDDARVGKETVFGNSMFGIAIENFNHRGWFSEKILDCFLMKTIPIYWGCSNIGDYFNINGIIRVENVDDIIWKCNNIEDNFDQFYEAHKYEIEENYQKALQYVDYEQNIINKIEEIFKLNELI
jgi:hypothetical protein